MENNQGAGDARIIESGKFGDNITWTLDEEGLLVLRGRGNMGECTGDSSTGNIYPPRLVQFVRHPELIKKAVIVYGVTKIGMFAFSECYYLTSVQIPGSVTEIEDHAFCYCYQLTDVTLPNGLTKIGHQAFCGCQKLTGLTLPSSYTGYLSGYSINECSNLSLLSVAPGNPVYHSEGNCIINTESKELVMGCKDSVIPSDGSVTRIGDCAFVFLTDISIPASVTEIEPDAFFLCNNLISITVAPGNPVYRSAGNCIIETASKTLIIGCLGSVIPSDGSVTKIGEHAFSCLGELTGVTIPAGVTEIGDYAFSGCDGMTGVVLPASLKKIGDGAFEDMELIDVYFDGTEAQWNAIEIGEGNEGLTEASVHFAG